jgi:hypothetical protein
MDTPENEKKIRLQVVGWVPADEVGNLEIGDRIMWNGGETSEVTAVEQVSRCFRLISLQSSKTGKEETPRKLKNTSLVARIPQAKEEPPAATVERPAAEGQIVPAGHTLGIPAEYADDANARDAYGALVAAGHTPALLANETDEDDTDTARGTGFVVYTREGVAVLVGHLVDGVDMWDSLPDTERRQILRTYRDTLLAAGWETEKRVMGKRLHAWRSSPLPEGVTLAQTRGETAKETPEGPVKVRFGLSDETRAQLKESAGRTRDEHRTEFDARRRQEAARHEPLPVGTRVRHAAQAWATRVQAPKGTAVVVGVVGQTHADGSFEYKVTTGRDFARSVGPDNPMDQPGEWNSDRVREVAPPRFEARSVSGGIVHGVWDVDTDGWVATNGTKENAEEVTEALNVGRLTLDAYGRIQYPGQPLPEMPTADGHRFEIVRTPGRTTIRMYADGQAAPVFEDWTGFAPDEDVVPMIAREMVRVRRNGIKEAAALRDLDDATMYQVATSAGDVETMTGAAARARLQSYRETAGPEKLHSRNTPRVTLAHSGAHWMLTVHAYRNNGNRDFSNNLRVTVEPLVTARAAQVLRQATGGGTYVPVETLSVEAFGPWVRATLAPREVVVYWVACGTPVKPGAERYAEHMETYRGALEAAGWTFQGDTVNGGILFQEPATTA